MENLAVVQSAVSSFNNVALRVPDFFWAAVLALPIFIAAWIFAGDIAKRFIKRNDIIPTILIALMPIWILSHGSFAALRNFSYAPFVAAAALFVCAFVLTRRAIAADWIPSRFVRENWVRRTDFAMPILIAGGAGLCAIDGGFDGFVLNFSATLIGIAAGYCSQSRNAKTHDPKTVAAIVMCMAVFAIAMQPEFFRWGQLGNLTAIHIVALVAATLVFAPYFVLGIARARGKYSDTFIKRFKIAAYVVAIAGFAVFGVTESAVVFAGLFAVIAIITSVILRHAPANSDWKSARQSLWILCVGAFGIIAALPVFTCIAIILWHTGNHKELVNFIKLFKLRNS